MILPFSQKFPDGKPTYFAEKIWIAGRKSVLFDTEFNTYGGNFLFSPTSDYNFSVKQINIISREELNPKLHTIRYDSKDRWKAGNKIHPVYNNRSKNQFQFAPTFICKGVQQIKIIYEIPDKPLVYIDSFGIHGKDLERLAINDGFESVSHFYSWFKEDFTGKIIHFTDLIY